MPAFAFNSRVVVGIDGDEIVRHRPWIRQIVSHGLGRRPFIVCKTGLFPTIVFFPGHFPRRVRKYFLFASILIGDRKVQDDSAGAAAVDHGGAESIRATNHFFCDVILLGGAVSGDAGGLMFNTIAVHLLDCLVGDIELCPEITFLINTFSCVFRIDNPLRFRTGQKTESNITKNNQEFAHGHLRRWGNQGLFSKLWKLS